MSTVPGTSAALNAVKMQRQILDWIEVARPERGNVLVLRVPTDLFIHPGTAPQDVTPEQIAAMTACQQVLRTLLDNLAQNGVRMGGAAILADNMTLEDLPPPPGTPAAAAKAGIVLPPGTQL